jgi:hypothetical protein
MTWTTYCMKHETLEAVDEVTKVHPFIVGAAQGKPEGRSACEVRAVTVEGCRAHFIGGPKWSR